MQFTEKFRSGAAGLLALACAANVVSCAGKNLGPPGAGAGADNAASATTRALRGKVDTIVVIFAENRAFDNLYGNFPGARGLREVLDGSRPLPAYSAQVDRNGTPLPVLPPAWGGVTAGGASPVVTQQQSTGLANAPFSIERAYTAASHVTLSTTTVTRDLWHRFFEHQMQIDGGNRDGGLIEAANKSEVVQASTANASTAPSRAMLDRYSSPCSNPRPRAGSQAHEVVRGPRVREAGREENQQRGELR